MKYLEYYVDGFQRKYPLEKVIITIGRTEENDLQIENEFISREHVRIRVKENFILIRDLESSNGLFVNNQRVKEAKIKEGGSFSLGKINLFLKRGQGDDFKTSEKYIPLIGDHTRKTAKKISNLKTDLAKNIYKELLEKMMSEGLKKKDLNELFLFLSHRLSDLTEFGSLFLVSKEKSEHNILFSLKRHSGIVNYLKELLHKESNIFKQTLNLKKRPEIPYYISTFPLRIGENQASLLFMSKLDQKKEDPEIKKFLTALTKGIEIIALLHEDRRGFHKSNKGTTETEEDIIAVNPKMRELIKQTKKIAATDIFILIQGESGTGKELFARYIHKYSKRAEGEFIALNCAAIPENLLESELFGHEKGAYTGAYTQKKGKLEMASGGTLVLDEIGDMPLSLQSKLLRALQENEFYRLGGSTPIKVNLRIISLTHQDLKQLIEGKQFREDLYFRLVHRCLIIPPLKERKEDISILINHFTNKFCRLEEKTIKGYSMKAFETLINYFWRGNVRQLENEVKSIVSLTDDGQIIDYNILSPEIKRSDSFVNTLPQKQEPSPTRFHEKPGEELILQLLKKNNGNKSKTAKDLNMTYQGLHKKMKKLGIEIPPKSYNL